MLLSQIKEKIPAISCFCHRTQTSRALCWFPKRVCSFFLKKHRHCIHFWRFLTFT